MDAGIGGEGYGHNVGVPDPVLIRPVTGEDRRLLLSGFARFGERSRQQRFMGVKVKLTEAELAFSRSSAATSTRWRSACACGCETASR